MRGVLSYQFRQTTVVALFCSAVLTGLGLAQKYTFTASAALLSVGIALVLSKRRSVMPALTIIICGLCIGGWRGSVWQHTLANYQKAQGRELVIVGTAVDDAVYGQKHQLSFDLQHITTADRQHMQLPGKIGISGFGAVSIYRDDIVMAKGKLYPGKGGHQAWMSFALLKVKPQPIGPINRLRQRFDAGLQSSLPEPLASFGLGLLIGQRSTIPSDIAQNLLMVGLVHIIAVSGYNLTILLQASRKLLGRRSIYQATALSLALIGIFILITGNSPSIIRAAVVSVLGIIAAYSGRSFKPAVLLLLAAAITAFANPLQIWGDVSWYLSFLAFTGVMLIGPLLHEHFVPKKLSQSVLIGVGLESIAAEVMTLPYVLHIFGQMSRISLLANILVVALVPLAMLLTLIAGLAGMLVPFLSGWFAWPATILLRYMLDTARLLADVPHIFVENIYMSTWQMIFAYGLVAFGAGLLNLKSRRKSAIITDEDNKTEDTPVDVRSQQMVNN